MSLIYARTSLVILPAIKSLGQIYVLKLNLLSRLKKPPENQTFILFPAVYLAMSVTDSDCVPDNDVMITV